jgi:hypothetical protein
MAIQYKISLINDRLNLLNTDAGNSPVMHIFSGAMPAHCVTADSGTKLTEDVIPVATGAFMASASAGAVAKTGTWTLNGLVGAGAGTNAGYFRIMDAAIANCYMQGTITATGGGGDMTMDNISIANAQVVTINTFAITGGNA